MSGYIGNPTNLWLSNVTIQFVARRPFYSARAAFMKASANSVDRLFISPEQIGTAQTKPIKSLIPGMREHFEVTIRNAKQSKDGIDIRVSFTGERLTTLGNTNQVPKKPLKLSAMYQTSKQELLDTATISDTISS
jgi:hypothetical protein